ncbi:hypothetical protein OIU77_012934 [Salix suchowensis]|uniref:Uncharacterized protein n=1 Tax=Salix suchowensis TaxID=1278906 RepID=A0ABQ9A6J8_9ROSI|nr:hypothetical protein OIU77_012934 [Salix suchowensis]
MADHGRSRFSYVQEWSSALEHREACLAVAFLAVFLAMVFIPEQRFAAPLKFFWENEIPSPASHGIASLQTSTLANASTLRRPWQGAERLVW